MLITSNSKNIFNESKKSKQIFLSYQESFDLNSYKRLQDAIISNDLNKLEKELKSGNNPNNQNNLGDRSGEIFVAYARRKADDRQD